MGEGGGGGRADSTPHDVCLERRKTSEAKQQFIHDAAEEVCHFRELLKALVDVYICHSTQP